MSAGATSAYGVFAREFGGVPDGEWAAPGRVNIIGEHTDYSGGFVLPVAIDRFASVAGRSRDDGTLRITSVQLGEAPEAAVADLEPGPMTGWWAYAHGIAWALRELGVAVPGADLVVDSAVPLGAGLSSSAALEISIGRALADLAGAEVTPTDLALAGQRAERVWTGTPCGVMDQMTAASAREGHALLLDTRSLEVEQIPFDLASPGLRIVVIDTRVTHTHADGEYAVRVQECRSAAELLEVAQLREATPESVDAAAGRLGEVLYRRARHVVTENARVHATAALMRAGRLDALGPLLAASHASLRDDFDVSVPELDTAVAAALSAGAVAARMTGGGFGGSVVALVETNEVPALQRSVRAAFESAGFGPPETLAVSTADGAGPRR